MNSEIKASAIKGIPVADILKELKKGSYYDAICRRYPALNDEDIRSVVRFRNKKLIPALLKKRRSYKAIAKQFGTSVSRVGSIKKKLKEEKQMRKKWGNLSTGVISRIKGILRLIRKAGPPRFHWWRPECGKAGVITDYGDWPANPCVAPASLW